MVVENKVLMKVVFPRPDSPATWDISAYSSYSLETCGNTMMVNAAPRLATILCLDAKVSQRWIVLFGHVRGCTSGSEATPNGTY